MKTRSNHAKSNKTSRKPAAPVAAAAPQAQTARLTAQALLPWVALPLLALLVYWPTLHAQYIWDDDALTDNPLVRAAGGLLKIWFSPTLLPKEEHYWPLVYSSFWLEHLLFGMRPAIFHFTNVALHGAACLLLWRTLRRLAVPGAWLGAALFAVHPVHVESVAWIIERKDVLSGALYFGAALAYLRFHETPAAEPRRWRAYALCAGLFLLALLSKSIVVTLPVALALALWLRQGRLTLQDVIPLAPLAALAGVVTLADMHFTRLALSLQNATMVGSGLALPERILMAGGSFWFYLLKLAWPHPLTPFYPTWDVRPGNPLAWAPLLGAAALLAGLWLARRRIGRGPAAAAAFFGLTLAPALGVVDFSFLRLSWVADRFQYLASAGPLALAAAGAALAARRWRWPAGAARGGAAALLALLGLACFRQAGLYESSLTLFRASVERRPQMWQTRYNYGYALLDSGRNAEAAAELREALRLKTQPDNLITFNLAMALKRDGDFKAAEPMFQETLRIAPTFASGHHNYAAALVDAGRLEEGIAHYREALRLRPNYPDTFNNLGNVMRRMNKNDEAEALLREAVRLNPEGVAYHLNLAGALLSLNKLAEAQAECETALRLKPDLVQAQDTMGQILMAMGRLPEAVERFAAALRAQPEAPGFNFHMAEALAQLGRKAEAIECYKAVLRAAPQSPGVRERIAALGG